MERYEHQRAMFLWRAIRK